MNYFRDAKIAALEKTGQESEKLIAEARSDKLKQMEEVHAAQKKVSELESRYLNLNFFNYCTYIIFIVLQ